MDYIIKPLVHIFNLCFEPGTHPSKMETTKLLPTLKKGKRGDISNYISSYHKFLRYYKIYLQKDLTVFFNKLRVISNSQYVFKTALKVY